MKEGEMRLNVENDIFKGILEDIYCEHLKDGDVYSYDELKRTFTDNGIPNERFDSLFQRCVEHNWLIDCGGGCYTR